MSARRPGSVVQEWVSNLPSLMLQSVLLTAIRGPDTLPKEHVSKYLCRFLRRSILLSAFDGVPVLDPAMPGGGSFTGPSIGNGLPWNTMHELLEAYLRSVDEVPHHFHLHLMHAAEILGYFHPGDEIGLWWRECYFVMVHDAHLVPESKATLTLRLSDSEEAWRDSEAFPSR